MKTPIYFIYGKVIAESGNIKVYEFNEKLFLERGPGHNLWADSAEVVEYTGQLKGRPKGDCLEIGLGLGVASEYILSSFGVISLTTVEVDSDVISTYNQLTPLPQHHVIHFDGYDYLLQTEETFDFIFLDFYDIIDEDTLPAIEIVGWWDIYTPDEFTTKFFEIFED